MVAEVIYLSRTPGGKAGFSFKEHCPTCNALVSPFSILGRSTGRYLCSGSQDIPHRPIRWHEHEVREPLVIRRSGQDVTPDLTG